MKKLTFIAILVLSIVATACNKKCDCNKNWDETVTYKKHNSVLYNGKCWSAKSQGTGIVPGPWLANGNDIWEPCND